MSNPIPLGDNVLVSPQEKGEKTESGIYLAQKEEKPQVGTVLEVGKDVVFLKKGDKIFFPGYAPEYYKENQKEYCLVSEKNVVAKIEENAS